MNNLIQLKMTGGDEVICEVMEWPDEHGKDLIIRNAMVLSYSFDEDFTNQVYGLKPWFSMIENPMEYIVVNTDHVMSTAKPNSSFIREYNEALIQMHSLSNKRRAEERQQVKEFEERFKEKLEEVANKLSGDSATSNIFQFPSPDTSIH